MKVTERRLVNQIWYEDENSKNGWDSNGWQFLDSGFCMNDNKWQIVETLQSDKFGRPILAIAEKETEV